MTEQEAKEWFSGKRSMMNMIPLEPRETWNIRIAQADEAMMKQAYIYLKAKKEGLID